jgi:hypothetical protein
MDGFTFLIVLSALAAVAAVTTIVAPTRERPREPD